ncbi:Cytochrome bo(3) ubiquinol oxidase subunit 3 [Serratia symbiotica]|nr:Cytochrome bo(3) ubiquinol oxidase subunit 3 [Serratia symbiotica]
MFKNILFPINSINIKHKSLNIEEIKIFGFWIYLMSDCIFFACLFASYILLVHGTAGGPTGKEIFQLNFILIETFLLLFSSITYGMVMIFVNKNQINHIIFWLLITFIFGFIFCIMEFYEFYNLIIKDFGPNRSAFLSSFFTLVGTHSLHVFIGLIWIIIMIIQVSQNGLMILNKTRLICLSLFWHFLDVIWICLFTVVYLLGVII